MNSSIYKVARYYELISPTSLIYPLFKIIGLMFPAHIRARHRYIFKYLHYRKYVKTLVDNALDRGEDSVLFAIVHLNAPDFLLLALEAIRKLYPEKPLVVLDNGSYRSALTVTIKLCEKYRCRLLHNTSRYKDHTLAIQYLIDYSAQLGKEFSIILDNDTVLASHLDDVLEHMKRKGFVLAGPHDLIKFDGRYFRFSPLAVHASLLILKPMEVLEIAGRYCSFNYIISKYSKTPEPYHSLAYVCLGRILYLEPIILRELFPLTTYIFSNRIIAYHAW